VAEWFKAPVLKTGRGFTLPRGFESHPFRQIMLRSLSFSTFSSYFEATIGSTSRVPICQTKYSWNFLRRYEFCSAALTT
jgi:hypothetical protein